MSDQKPSAEAMNDLRSFILREVRAGFAPPNEIAESAVEVVLEEESDGPALRSLADQCVAEALAELREDQKRWPEETDCDRLDAAFAALEEAGVLARQNYACCQNCGHGEIWDEVKAAEAEGRALRGYTFYHLQDTERAVEGGGLYLAYGATQPGDEAEAAVGSVIAEALRAQGLEVVWNGSNKARLFVKLVWQRRRADMLL